MKQNRRIQIYLFLIAILLNSCASESFLIKKYFHGNAKHRAKIDETTKLFSESNSKNNSIIGINNTFSNEEITGAKEIEKLENENVKELIIPYKSFAKHTNLDERTNAKGLTNYILTAKDSLKVREKAKFNKKENNNNSILRYYIRIGILSALFWIILFAINSNVLATELVGALVSIQILGIVLIAAIVWITIYVIFEKLS